MSKKKILVTGGNGRFAKILKKNNRVLNLYFADKIECNILKFNSIIEIIKKVKPKVILHTAGLSRPMSMHEQNISKSIDLNIIGTANLVKACEKFNIKLIYFLLDMYMREKLGTIERLIRLSLLIIMVYLS